MFIQWCLEEIVVRSLQRMQTAMCFLVITAIGGEVHLVRLWIASEQIPSQFVFWPSTTFLANSLATMIAHKKAGSSEIIGTDVPAAHCTQANWRS